MGWQIESLKNEMRVNEKTFCINPWSEIRIAPDGSLSYCHASYTPTATDIGYSDNISSLTLDQYFNGKTVNFVRDQLLQGSEVKWCRGCYSDEKIIESSFRRRRNIQMAIFPEKDFDKSLNESSFPDILASNKHKPFFYNISTSNLCNLGCVMCGEKWSSRLATEFKRIGITRDYDSRQDQPALLDWSYDDAIWEKFMEHILNNDQIVCVHFQGGEPLLQKRVLEFIDRCIGANHVDFHFTTVTNGTVYDESMIEKLKKFKSVQIEISIENLDKSNDYVRYPCRTEKVWTNIQNFLRHRNANFDIVVRTVPQLLTVLEYDALLTKCLDHDLMIDSNVIRRPDFFSVSLLPDHLKIIVRQRLQEFITANSLDSAATVGGLNVRNRGYVKLALVNNARMILTALDQQCHSNDDAKALCRDYLEKLDRSRGIDLHDYCPQIADWLYV